MSGLGVLGDTLRALHHRHLTRQLLNGLLALGSSDLGFDALGFQVTVRSSDALDVLVFRFDFMSRGFVLVGHLHVKRSAFFLRREQEAVASTASIGASAVVHIRGAKCSVHVLATASTGTGTGTGAGTGTGRTWVPRLAECVSVVDIIGCVQSALLSHRSVSEQVRAAESNEME